MEEVRRLMIVLHEKPKGGRRTITFYKRITRVWQKLTKQQVKEWEQEVAVPNFSCGPGKSCVDVSWRQAVRAESVQN